MTEWIGCFVSIKCSGGTYQGEITTATYSEIVLKKAFCNGIPCRSPNVTILAADITDLKLIDKQASTTTGQSTVVIAKPVPKRAGRSHSLSENTPGNKPSNQASSSGPPRPKPTDIPYNNGPPRSKPTDIQYNNGPPRSKPTDIPYNNGPPRSKPTDIPYSQERQHAPTESGSFKNTPNKKDSRAKKWNKGWKDEACFGSPLDQNLSKDFDFEKNLALFNKQAVFEEINSQKPDVVKNADQKRVVKYRHDENVIATQPTTFRQITVPKTEFCEYVTDDGLIIPTISPLLKKKLWAVADRIGLSWERRTELMGRATTEMVVQLLGGGRRLNPQNSHQCPTVVIFCGPNRQGAMGISAARHLSSQGVNTIVYNLSSEHSYIKQELSLYKLTKNKMLNNISAIPHTVDFIIVALCDDTDNLKLYNNICDWVSNNKAPVLCIDPPAAGTPGIVAKYSIVPVLPLLHSIDNGKIYLCNLGFPLETFIEVGIKYKSPFGNKFVIPLHANDT